MNDFKGMLASKTVWGGIVTLIFTLLTAFGVDLGSVDQAGIVDNLTMIGAAAGALFTIYGRVKADKKIATKKNGGK